MKNVIFERSVRLSVMAGAATIGLSAFVFARPAVAEEPRPIVVVDASIVTRSVGTDDLNLASSPGKVTLNRRVRVAIEDLCSETTGSDGRFWTLENSQCQTSAWKQARPQIDRAVQRARDIASNGTSAIAATAISVALPN